MPIYGSNDFLWRNTYAGMGNNNQAYTAIKAPP